MQEILLLTGVLLSVTIIRMLKIRLQRVGRKHDPSFRIVVGEHQNAAQSGKYLEMLGSYNARQGKPTINAERVKYWMGHGAKASDTMHNLLVSEKIIEGKKVNVLPKKSPVVKEKTEEAGEDKPKEEKKEESAQMPEGKAEGTLTDEAVNTDKPEPKEDEKTIEKEIKTNERSDETNKKDEK